MKIMDDSGRWRKFRKYPNLSFYEARPPRRDDWVCDGCDTIISGVRPSECYEIVCDILGEQWLCELCYRPDPEPNQHPTLTI